MLRGTERRMAVTCTVEKINSRGRAIRPTAGRRFTHTREPIAFFCDGLIIPYDQRAIDVRGHPEGAAHLRSKQVFYMPRKSVA